MVKFPVLGGIITYDENAQNILHSHEKIKGEQLFRKLQNHLSTKRSTYIQKKLSVYLKSQNTECVIQKLHVLFTISS